MSFTMVNVNNIHTNKYGEDIQPKKIMHSTINYLFIYYDDIEKELQSHLHTWKFTSMFHL